MSQMPLDQVLKVAKTIGVKCTPKMLRAARAWERRFDR